MKLQLELSHRHMTFVYILCLIAVPAKCNTTPVPDNGATNTATPATSSRLPAILETLSNRNGSDSNILADILPFFVPGISGENISLENIGALLSRTLSLELPTATGGLPAGRIGPECLSDFLEILEGLSAGKLWALQNSYGKPERGILQGDLHWMGNYDQCLSFYRTMQNVYKQPDNPTHFDTKYCRVNMPTGQVFPAQLQMLGKTVTIGSCVPKSCSPPEISALIVTIQTVLNMTEPSTPTSMTCIEDRPLETDGIAVICVLTFIGLLILTGTIYDVITVQMPLRKSTKGKAEGSNGGGDVVLQSFTPTADNNVEKAGYVVENDKNGNTESMNGGYDGGCTIPVTSGTLNFGVSDNSKSFIVGVAGNNEKASALKKTGDKGVLERMLLSFSAYTNGVKLLSTGQAAGTLGAVNGIRFLSMTWVILGHTITYGTTFSNNFYNYGMVNMMERWTFLGIANGTFSVDTFFTLSGLLVAYLTLKELQKVGGAKRFHWIMFYFHRFWRLTPPYMLVVMVGTVLYPHLVEGPMRYDASVISNCRKWWWTNLLYVNNLVHAKDTCMGWSWYLANDMQFYVLSPLMLLPLFYNVFAGVASCLVFLSVTVGVTAYITHTHEYRAQNHSPFLPPQKDENALENIYLPCYTRMGPYIVGVFTGYLLYAWKCKCKIPRILNLGLWLLALSSCCAIVYSTYNKWDSHIFTQPGSTAYWALARTGWGVAISWIVFACATGNGGWIDELLSWKAFVPLGRLSYCTYLIHPLLIAAFNENLQQQVHLTDYTLAYMFVGHVVFSYGGAFLTSLAFEGPMMGLEKAIFKRK